jgi:hypothetical protein
LFRYIAIGALSKSKKVFYTSKLIVVDGVANLKEKRTLPIRILKLLQNPIINLGVAVVYLFIYLCIQMIIYIIANYAGQSKNGCVDGGIAHGIVQSVSIVILILIWFIGVFLDVLQNLPDIFCSKAKKLTCNCLHIFRLFLTKDPFLFRIETYFFGFLMVVLFLVLSLVIIIDPTLETNRAGYIVIYSLFSHALLFYQVLFVLFCSIIDFIRKIIKFIRFIILCGKTDEQYVSVIDQILSDKKNGGYTLVS